MIFLLNIAVWFGRSSTFEVFTNIHFKSHYGLHWKQGQDVTMYKNSLCLQNMQHKTVLTSIWMENFHWTKCKHNTSYNEVRTLKYTLFSKILKWTQVWYMFQPANQYEKLCSVRSNCGGKKEPPHEFHPLRSSVNTHKKTLKFNGEKQCEGTFLHSFLWGWSQPKDNTNHLKCK